MRNIFLLEACKETQLHALNPQSWLQVERGKLTKSPPFSPSSIESLIKVPEPPVLPFYKPVDFVEVLTQIHEELESCPPHESLRQKIAALSTAFNAMLNGDFTESLQEDVDFSKNGISPSGMREIRDFSETGSLNEICPDLLLEVLIFSNKFCYERLKDACDRKLSSFVTSREEAVDLMEYAIAENSNVLAASCLQVFLHDLPNCLSDDRVARIFRDTNRQHRAIMAGSASFSLYCLLSEVAMARDPCSDIRAYFLEQLVESSVSGRQRQLSFHQLGCARPLWKEYDEAERLFEAAVSAGHVYSVAGLARLDFIKGWKQRSCDKLSSVISSFNPLGWMYQERALYCEGEKKCDNLEKATKLDPTLNYLYMYRAAWLMRNQSFCFYLALEDYRDALCDVQAILTLSPEYRMFEGRVAATQLCTLVREHVDNWTATDFIYQMLESDAAKGVLYFRQSLLLLSDAKSTAGTHNAASEHEHLVYEGWILYDTGHCEEGLRKAKESISLQRSFEAFFLKAYALADSRQSAFL
ncbi:hypothetical protein IFM89_033808 [Coptis chinensis]|uniref:Uncharacterized protein n=1 Tax=Coptis chinensis TaxID=261450 RepID=A0A835LPB5_9MAGN|nr:hypothetical protein IFM89_033808 [Coptis chinensis]